MGLGLADVSDVRREDYDVDGRFVSRALVELTLNAHDLRRRGRPRRRHRPGRGRRDRAFCGGTTLPDTLAGDTIDGPE